MGCHFFLFRLDAGLREGSEHICTVDWPYDRIIATVRFFQESHHKILMLMFPCLRGHAGSCRCGCFDFRQRLAITVLRILALALKLLVWQH